MYKDTINSHEGLHANTLENKAKFIALHYGQKVYYQQNGKGGQELDPFHVSVITLMEIEHCKLLLKPTSSITNQDAIDLAVQILKYDKEDYHIQDLLHVGKSVATIFPKTFPQLRAETIVGIGDFLRSRGYALPWLGISVEKMSEWNWIKLVP